MKRILFAFLGVGFLCGCSGGGTTPDPTPTPEPTPVSFVFAKGADVSWVTQMESEGLKFYDASGNETECMKLLKEQCGVNAIRLRVWVNPADGWCGVEDVLVKARRANSLGLRLMIDFHFSDSWADPGQQVTPAAWQSYDFASLKTAAAAHVTEVLTKLRAENIIPEWVQIGNETPDGMLFPLGQASKYPANFAGLVTAGYEAVKGVCPDAKVIVHVDQGQTLSRFTWLFDILQSNGAKYDMIGMSLYPDPANATSYGSAVLTNVQALYQKYGKPVMLCEIGMHYSQGSACRDLIARLMASDAAKEILQGIFYWEPETPETGYNGGYDKGCFIGGAPTVALSAFR